MLGAALGAALGAGCATAPAPVPPPSPVVQSLPSPPPAPPAPAPIPVRSSLPSPGDIVVHQSDLHGQFESRQGSTITIHALLKMSKTQPAVGNKAVLFYAPPTLQGESDWVVLGDVEVKKELDAEGKIQVKMIDDEKKFMIPGGKRPTPLVKKTRLRLRWEW